MRVVVVGLGVQGAKRRRVAADDVVATVDPVVQDASYRSLEDVPVSTYDAAILCVPDAAKHQALRHLVEAGKHVLVEKPLIAPGTGQLADLERVARSTGALIVTAYNHRFEPHLARLREIVATGELGTPYRISMFYGNGTARDVRSSPWRDRGLGVVTDLAPHLLDTLVFLVGRPVGDPAAWAVRAHENAAPDHFVFGWPHGEPAALLEGSLLSWRNTFRLDLVCSAGSAHVEGLCKWGPSRLTVRSRVLPSGKPDERVWTLEQADPTWVLEYEAFRDLCARGGSTDLGHDRWIDDVLVRIASHGAALS